MRRSLSIVIATLSLLGCGSNGEPTASNRVAEVMILRDGVQADSMYAVPYFGSVTFTAIALNAKREELSHADYVLSWNSTDGSIASVTDGVVSTNKNGSAFIIAQSADFADTVRLAIAQVASNAHIRQDSVVAFTPGATKLSGAAIDETIQKPDTLRFEAYITDAAGTSAPSDSVIHYTNVDPGVFTIVPNTKGDTVKIIGIAAGTGRIAVKFLTTVDTLRVRVVSSYAVVTLNQQPGATIVTPSTVTIPAGAAVLFQNSVDGGSFLVLGSGWSVGPIPGRLREANAFLVPGTFSYTVGNATASVVVTP